MTVGAKVISNRIWSTRLSEMPALVAALPRDHLALLREHTSLNRFRSTFQISRHGRQGKKGDSNTVLSLESKVVVYHERQQGSIVGESTD